MISAALDSSIVTPAGAIAHGIAPWVALVRMATNMAASEVAEINSRPVLVQQAASSWWENRKEINERLERCDSPLGVNDLLPIVDSLLARTIPTVGSHTCLVSGPSTTPKYVPSELSSPERSSFVEFLGEFAACSCLLVDRSAVVLTNRHGWEWPTSEIDVRATAEAIECDGQEVADHSYESNVSMSIPAVSTSHQLYEVVLRQPLVALKDPRLAIRAQLSALGFKTSGFDVSPKFVDSLRALGYGSTANAGRLSGCTRAAAFVASKRTMQLPSLKPHPFRKSIGGSSLPVRRSDGEILYRGWLEDRPNAHRLYWWGGDKPELVGVASHDDKPPI